MSFDTQPAQPPGQRKAGNDRRDIVERATALAMDVADRGLDAIVGYMERGGGVGATRDVERTAELAVRGINQATKLTIDQTTDGPATSVEDSLIDLAEAIGPKVAFAAARLATRKKDLEDAGPRNNVIVVLRELAGLATSVLNESVGTVGPASPVAAGPARGDFLRVSASASSQPVEIKLPILNEAWTNATGVSALAAQVTPLVGSTHVVAAPQLTLPDTIAAHGIREATLSLGDAVRADTYRGSIHVLDGEALVTSADLEVVITPEENGNGGNDGVSS